jgi:DNA ligase-1
MEYPTLYKLTSTGAIQQWTIYTVGSTIVTEYGQRDGSMQNTSDTISVGKNIGRSNETSPTEQANLEAQARWEKKCKKHYVQDVNDAICGKVDTSFVVGGLAPMLAQNFDKRGHKIVWPALVQPKLDGHRCVALVVGGVCTLWSRSQKPITSMPHIVAEIESMLPGQDIVLDGELYNHDYRDKFEELTRLIRPPDPRQGKENVQFHVYDMISDESQDERIQDLILMSKSGGWNYVKFVDTFMAMDEGEMEEFFLEFEELGYEGAIIRNVSGKYVGKRSVDLQKVKNMHDSEFMVVDVTQGRGKMEGKAIFVCEADNGETFNVKMVGSFESLENYLDNKEFYIGKELTVKYQGLSNYGIPRFPIGLRFRDEI